MMKNVAAIIMCFFIVGITFAQSNQTVNNGQLTAPVKFPVNICAYTWTNDSPGIGLAASGSGDIASFTAVNTGTTPVKATITVTPVGSAYAYVANYGSDDVSVISMATSKVVATIPVGKAPWGVSVSPDGYRVYVSNHDANTVSVIDAMLNKVVATIPVGNTPKGLAISKDGKKVYVTDSASNAISVISTATNQVVSTIPSHGLGPQSICVTPTGDSIYVAHAVSHSVTLINTIRQDSINTKGFPYPVSSVGVSINGNFAYACGMTEFDYWGTRLNDPFKGFTSNNNNHLYQYIAVGPDGKHIFCTTEGPPTLEVGSPQFVGDANANTLPAGSDPQGVAETTNSTVVCVVDGRGSLYLIKTYTLTEPPSFKLAPMPPLNPTVVKVGTHPISVGNFIGPQMDCGSGPYTFTITVNPPSPHVLNAGQATGNIAACAGTPSADPDLQQFDVSGNNLLADMNLKAPAGFELSLNRATGYTDSLVIKPVNGNTPATTVYARSSMTAPAGDISGDVILSSQGAYPVTVSLSGEITAIPYVNAPADVTVPDGRMINAITFSGMAPGYTWTNDNTAIGIPAAGTAGLPAFNAVNKTNQPVIAHITITPLTANGCPGNPVSFIIRINPSLTIPSAFTPNGDGINDQWDVQNLDSYANCTVRVFNRWGIVVFSSVGYSKPWDGRRNGSPLPEGTYYYLIDTRNDEPVFSGWVVLVR